MLRIAITKNSFDSPESQQYEKTLGYYPKIIKLIKSHLSSVNASIFAQPVLQKNNAHIEWYTDLQGQPQPLLSLPEKEQLQAKKLLTARLAAIAKLAEQLSNLAPGDGDLQAILHNASQFPEENSIYVINGQPVITSWGNVNQVKANTPLSHTSTSLPGNLTPPLSSSPKSKFKIFKMLLWLLLLAALIGLLWFWFSKHPLDLKDYNPFIDKYQLLLDEINAAENDCLALKKIYNENPLINTPEEKFIQLKAKVEAKLQWCAAYDNLQQQIQSAQGNCQKLETILATNPYLQNPEGPFIELKQQLETDIRLCHDFRELNSAIDAAKDDCPVLSQLREENPHLQQAEGMFLPLRKRVEQLIGECKAFQGLTDSIQNAQNDCAQLDRIVSETPSLQDPREKYVALKQQLDNYRQDCKRKQIENSVNLCPGERPKQLAPELVVVFDSSGSMAYPSDLRKSREFEQQIAKAGFSLNLSSLLLGKRVTEQQVRNLIHRLSPEQNSRMRGAKTAVRKLVQKTPSDMDIGLVVLKDCPGANKYGFYPPGKRQEFLGTIEGLKPKNGTPLGDAIRKAGQMVDGVNKAATMVVISDGEESCGANPCTIARKLAAQKPYLTINVVDILGTGAGNCVAKATKNGKVFTARNMQDIIDMTEKAADTAIPKNCK